MNRDNMNIILKGMWIGGTMTVPGVSGGSMAMIMGVYDRLISSISSFFKEPAESMAFLLKFVLGAGIGMVLFSRFISYLFTTRADVPLRFFFLGAVAGGVPMIYREAGVKKLDLGAVAYPVIGIWITSARRNTASLAAAVLSAIRCWSTASKALTWKCPAAGCVCVC